MYGFETTWITKHRPCWVVSINKGYQQFCPRVYWRSLVSNNIFLLLGDTRLDLDLSRKIKNIQYIPPSNNTDKRITNNTEKCSILLHFELLTSIVLWAETCHSSTSGVTGYLGDEAKKRAYRNLYCFHRTWNVWKRIYLTHKVKSLCCVGQWPSGVCI